MYRIHVEYKECKISENPCKHVFIHDAHSAKLGPGVLRFWRPLWWPVSELELALSAQCQASAIPRAGTPVPSAAQCLDVTVENGQKTKSLSTKWVELMPEA